MRSDGSQRWRRVALAAIAVTIVIGGALLKRRIDTARIETQQNLCVHNLHFMANALHRYAGDRDGNFPERFSLLYPEYLTAVEVLVCPEVTRSAMGTADAKKLSQDALDALSSYTLAPGRRIDDPPDTVLAWETGDHHGGRGHSILYVDGRGAWEPPQAR